MKFTCEKYLLQAAVSTAARAAAVKSPNPVLEGLLLSAGDLVKITGYDLVKGIYTSFVADVSERGSIVLSAKLLDNIVRSLPDDIVTVSADGEMVRIFCGNADFSIMGSDADNYPELPAVVLEGSISLPQGTLKKMINQTVFAVSDNEARPVYTGELFVVENGCLTVVAVDGYRLALRREALESAVLDCRFIVPGSALSDLEKLCSDADEAVKIVLGAKHISFSVNNYVLITRRLEGEFLDYNKAVPSIFEHELTVNRAELLSAVDRVSLIIDDRLKNPLRCVFGDSRVTMHCVTAIGKGEDICRYNGDGGGLEIGFNNRYLQDALKAAPSEELIVCLNSASAPCVLMPADKNESFKYMILPVRLKA
ncbi:MAG: DNA polymerase III subunit beta [Oscillospiraceae bacterium]|jgi:DNA polymerase-3 subunit beta|nr:DNA polymerase III subunit beta [Oscillospiraceae bacterium]